MGNKPKSLSLKGENIIAHIKQLSEAKNQKGSFPIEFLDWSLEIIDQNIDSKEEVLVIPPNFWQSKT